MARHTRMHSTLARTVAMLALVGMSATPALAQIAAQPTSQAERAGELYDQRWRDFRDATRQANAAQYGGECAIRDEALDRAERILRSQMELDRRYGGEGAMEEQEFRNLLGIIAVRRSRPCPGPAVPTEAAPVIAGGASEERSSDPDRAEPVGDRIVRDQQGDLELLERTLDDLERAWRSGDCDLVSLLAATFELYSMNDGGLTPPQTEAALYRRFNEIQASPCQPGNASYNSVQIAGGYGETTIPRTGYGFNRDGPIPAPERPAAFSEERIPMLVFEAGAQFRGIGRFRLGYAEGDASNRAEIPVSTTGGAQGTVNTDNAPSGSTGGAANRGLGIATEVDFQQYHADYRYDFYEPDYEPGPAAREYLTRPINLTAAYVELSADYRDREHFGEVAIPGVPAGTPPVINQVIEQDVGELELGAALGAEAVVPLGGGARLTFGVEAGLYYFDHDLNSLQTNTQTVGPTSDRAFTILIDDNESGVGYTGAIRAEFAIDLSGRPIDGRARGGVELFVGGEGRFVSDRAQVNNPFSGDFVLDGGTTFLGIDDSIIWQAGGGIRIHF